MVQAYLEFPTQHERWNEPCSPALDDAIRYMSIARFYFSQVDGASPASILGLDVLRSGLFIRYVYRHLYIM